MLGRNNQFNECMLIMIDTHLMHIKSPTPSHGEKSTQSDKRIQKQRILYTFKLCGLENKLRDCFGNWFEKEDAKIYLRDTLKQGSMSFEEYYNLFARKKEKSWMEDASFIDAMKRNVNYATQTSALNWQKVNGSDPVTFHNHVEMWSQTDWNLQQIKHWLPR